MMGTRVCTEGSFQVLTHRCMLSRLLCFRQEGADRERQSSLGPAPVGAAISKGEGNNSATPTSSSCDRHALSDSELMVQVAAGDEDAAGVLFERYRVYVFRTALAVLKDTGEAQDIVQETFFDLYQTARRFQSSRSSLATWLFRMASSSALDRRDYLRARRFYSVLKIEEAEAELLDRPDASRHLAVQERICLMHELLAKLKPARRLAVELRFLESLTAEEAALRSGMSPGTFENNLYRGLKDLSRLISAARP